MGDTVVQTEWQTGISRLADRVAVVTGASSGNGRAIALRLAQEGASVVIADLSKSARPEGFEADIDVDTDDVILAHDGQATFIEADVCSQSSMDEVAKHAASTYGRLDIWVNNAGVFLGGESIATASFIDESEETFDTTIAVNLRGTWHGCRAAARAMSAQQPLDGGGRGRIVNISSVAAQMGEAASLAYSASKAAVDTLTRNVAMDCAKHLINVNGVAPGYFPTAMNRETWDDTDTLTAYRALHPLPLGTPKDIAAAVAYLASDDASFITGQILPVDGGLLCK